MENGLVVDMRLHKFLSILLLALLAACSGTGGEGAIALPVIGQTSRGPEDVVKQFLDDWKAKNYAAMYAALSPQSQQFYTEAVFQTAYEDALNAINLSDMTYTLKETTLQGASAAVSYDVSLTSPTFGTISDNGRIMRLIQTANGWGIAWSNMDIVNGLTAGSRLDVQTRQPPRGNIYDRNGKLLVEEGATITALFGSQQDMPDVTACLDLLAHVLMRKEADLQTYFNNYNPETIFYLGEIDGDVEAQYGQQLQSTCATKSFPRTTRRYVGYGAAVHVTGYIGYPPQDELQSWEDRGYSPTDLVGRAGIEGDFQDQLAGQPEKILRIISPAGVVLRELGGKQGKEPQSVTLTLDRDLQLATASAIADAFSYAQASWSEAGRSPGAGAVVLDVKTGAVLAMVSFPFFDPGIFNPDTPALGLNPNLIVDLQNDPRQPFTNRVVQQQYFPGSTFKLITTAAAASEGVMTEPTFDCQLTWDGKAKYGDTSSPRFDWRKYELPDSPVKNPAGEVMMWQALAASCNPFFYEMGARLFKKDPNLLVSYAQKLGMGELTGIDMPLEALGNLPPPTAVEQGINEAIGQGGIQVTILQMARMVASIANGGTLYRPYVMEKVGGDNGSQPSSQTAPQVVGSNGLSEETMNIIRQGMCAVTTDNHIGTAWFDFENISYTVCGKTGTAQSGRLEPYGWFVAYAPADNPQIAIAAMVEYSREGSETAGPIVRRILDAYFKQTYAAYPKWWNIGPYHPLQIPDNETGG
jgi:penicillin-binding protein 2